MECTVVIRSRGRGWTDEKITCGELVKTADSEELSYLLDGDHCVLTISESGLVQKRRGIENIIITFKEGKYTECTIGEGILGSYKIFTRKAEVVRRNKGLHIALNYESGEDREPIFLTLTAYAK